MNTTIEDVLKKHVMKDKEMDANMFYDWSKQESYQLILAAMQEYASLQTPSNDKYWIERCEAAEEVIERFVVSPLHPDTSDKGKKVFAEWQELKSTPIPIQTPCVELEKEVERLKGLIKQRERSSHYTFYSHASTMTDHQIEKQFKERWETFKTENNL